MKFWRVAVDGVRTKSHFSGDVAPDQHPRQRSNWPARTDYRREAKRTANLAAGLRSWALNTSGGNLLSKRVKRYGFAARDWGGTRSAKCKRLTIGSPTTSARSERMRDNVCRPCIRSDTSGIKYQATGGAGKITYCWGPSLRDPPGDW